MRLGTKSFYKTIFTISVVVSVAVPLLFVASCSKKSGGKLPSDFAVKAKINAREIRNPDGNEYYKVGIPYRILGEWYRPHEDEGYEETGIASWYGPKFHKKPTANGAVFHKGEITAAHRTLPMPSIVRVTNLENGRSMKVKVNDRGPFAKDRIIDVSKAVAKKLGFLNKGTARVKVTYEKEASDRLFVDRGSYSADNTRWEDRGIGKGTKRTKARYDEPIVAPKGKRHFVQVAALSNRLAANDLVDEMAHLGDVKVKQADINGRTFYRVHLGPFGYVADADSMLNKIGKLGYKDAIIVKN